MQQTTTTKVTGYRKKRLLEIESVGLQDNFKINRKINKTVFHENHFLSWAFASTRLLREQQYSPHGGQECRDTLHQTIANILVPLWKSL